MIRTSNTAEHWEKLYTAFSDVSFVSYDFETIRQSLIDYTRIYYSEVFNDIITSSEYIAVLELFAYIAEQLAYRVDMVAHENFITTAQRKQSILRLAKLISYKATRNIPVRGLVKISSVVTSEQIIDSRGINLSGVTINWNDPNNTNWKEQFTLVMNRILTNRFGVPSKSFQVGDVLMDLYSLRNNPESFRNGVFAYTAQAGLDSYPMEIVPIDLDDNGPYEREPDLVSPLSVVYANDGIGDGSDYTGFLLYTKQGSLTRIDLNIAESLPNRQLEFTPTNVNETDVWVQKLVDNQITERWTQVDTLNEQNLTFNNNRDTRFKYEAETLENDQIKVIFGDGDFSDIPKGMFRFWLRQSANKSVVIQKNKIQNVPLEFTYTSGLGNTESATFTFGLTTTLQNGSATESIEHIRNSAPATYYAQNRMVNGQDYNTFPLKDPSILRIKAVNRTFAGQPKYIDWNDASGMYENIKLFGDDLTMGYNLSLNSQTTTVGGQALIDTIIEPLLNDPGVINAMVHISATDPATVGIVSAPRRTFIEDNRGGLFRGKNGNFVKLFAGSTPDGSLKEKTALQGVIDRHWYGEPVRYIQNETTGRIMAVIPDPSDNPKDDSRIYAANVPRTIDGVNLFPPGDIGSGLQPLSDQDYFGLKYNRYMKGIGDGTIEVLNTPHSTLPNEVWTIEFLSDGTTFAVRSNIRGSFKHGSIEDGAYEIQTDQTREFQQFFRVQAGTIAFEPGDAFVLDFDEVFKVRTSYPWNSNSTDVHPVINLFGWWQILGSDEFDESYKTGFTPDKHIDKILTTSDYSKEVEQHNWLIFVRKIRQQLTNQVIGYEVHSRSVELSVRSETTKFWYNEAEQILDTVTKKRVFDNIKILRSNVDINGNRLLKSQVYDVAGPVKDEDGVIDFHSLVVIPSDMLNKDDSGDLIPDNILQFENFVGHGADSYMYFDIQDPDKPLTNEQIIAAVNLQREDENGNMVSAWGTGSFVADIPDPVTGVVYGRRQAVTPGTFGETLDFMWQHFTPHSNIIDPSVTNINDIYVMTRGYYDNVINFVRGDSVNAPTPPTPLELRNSYGYLLGNKMISDTVVMHPGKIRLLFGALAEPQLRAKFKVVRSIGGTLTNERLKEEILNVINNYFDIENWDFGETFYATKLIHLIHQHLPADIASVVLVPVYSTNSFGSLFTVEPGFDEILQSAATLSDIEVVDALTPSIIRQVR